MGPSCGSIGTLRFNSKGFFLLLLLIYTYSYTPHVIVDPSGLLCVVRLVVTRYYLLFIFDQFSNFVRRGLSGQHVIDIVFCHCVGA